MEIQFRKANPSPREIYPDDLKPLINEFLRWIGPENVSKMIESYRNIQAGTIFSARTQEKQPLLEGFDEYRTLLEQFPGSVPFERSNPSIAWLARISQLFRTLAPTLSGQIEGDHRDKLLSLNGQFGPLLVEWTMASFYSRKYNAELAWSATNAGGPELAARSKTLEWELECKRISKMAFEHFGDSESDQLANTCIDEFKKTGRCWKISITISSKISGYTPDEILLIKSNIASRMNQESIDFEILDGLRLVGTSRPAPHPYIEAEFQEQEDRARNFGDRIYIVADNHHGAPINPIAVTINSPKLTSNEALDRIWERNFSKAAKQCTGTRGAVLAFEWSFIEDPQVFLEPFFQQLMHRTVRDYNHVSAIIMLCNPARNNGNTKITMNNLAYVATASMCRYPEISGLEHFDSERI